MLFDAAGRPPAININQRNCMAPRHKGNPPKAKSVSPHLPVLHLHAAGIDIGAREIYVAVPPAACRNNVRSFPTFTEDLHALRDWLQECGVTSVAMESTGVYWIPLFQILEAAGIEVCLVNARHCKNLPGRKTDVQDCQWLQYLHSVGLLRGSFRPADQVCAVRTILRHRDALVHGAGRCVSHLHKALTQMNVQLHHVISDLTGVTGQAILTALLNGERDPQKLAALKDHRIKASRDVIAKSLRGDWRAEHLFTLQQTYTLWQQHQQLIAACDAQIEAMLKTFDAQVDVAAAPLTPAKSSHKSLPCRARCGELGANRKGSCRPACHWCFNNPFRSLAPHEPTLSLAACVILVGRDTTPIRRLIICDWIMRPASGSTT